MRQGFRTAAALLKIHVLRRRVPLFVSWNITFRCNLRCLYCATNEVQRPELDTAAVCAGLDELWALGTRWITFGGGEPLVRRDMGAILQYAKAKGFAVFVSTNGVLLPEQAGILEWVDHVNLSLDGNREVHDLVRGAGTFDKALAALEVCRERGVGVSLQCVLNKNNLDAAEDAIAVAREYGTRVMFQPATRWLSSSRKPNPIAPDPDPYRRTMAQLVALKREGAPIRNSVAGLRHLARWPDPTRIWCIAGVLIAVVEADGSMLGCHQCQVAQFLKGQAMGGSLREQFAGLRLPEHCTECWCAPLVELALVFSLRPEPVLNAVRMN